MRISTTLALTALLSGCGHSQIAYIPAPPASMTIKQAVSIVEQGFYEDFSQQKPQSAIVTDEYIGLSNGSVSRGYGTGSATVYGGVVFGFNSTYVRTEEINQRIYLRAIGTPILSKKNARDNRYAVTIRTNEGTTARNVYFRSEQRAKEFANTLVWLEKAYASGTLTKTSPSASPQIEPRKSRQQLIQELQELNLPYEEYQQRYRQLPDY